MGNIPVRTFVYGKASVVIMIVYKEKDRGMCACHIILLWTVVFMIFEELLLILRIKNGG